MYVLPTYVEKFSENFIGIETTNSNFYTFLSGCDVIKIDLIIKQDGGYLMSLSFNNSETNMLIKI